MPRLFTMARPPQPAEPFHAPPEFLCVSGPSPVALPLGGQVQPARLRAFVQAMRAQGQPVQAARLGYDRRYAGQCLARAHEAGDAALRALAVELFEALGARAP